MTPEQIKEELSALYKANQKVQLNYLAARLAIQDQCPHTEYHWEHGYIEGWDEHYFTGTCTVCGSTIEVEEYSDNYQEFMDKYWKGEIE